MDQRAGNPNEDLHNIIQNIVECGQITSAQATEWRAQLQSCLERGADPNSTNGKGNNPLETLVSGYSLGRATAMEENIDEISHIVRTLMDAGANPMPHESKNLVLVPGHPTSNAIYQHAVLMEYHERGLIDTTGANIFHYAAKYCPDFLAGFLEIDDWGDDEIANGSSGGPTQYEKMRSATEKMAKSIHPSTGDSLYHALWNGDVWNKDTSTVMVNWQCTAGLLNWGVDFGHKNRLGVSGADAMLALEKSGLRSILVLDVFDVFNKIKALNEESLLNERTPEVSGAVRKHGRL